MPTANDEAKMGALFKTATIFVKSLLQSNENQFFAKL